MAILYFIDFHFFLFSTCSSRTMVSLVLDCLQLRFGLAGSDRTANGFITASSSARQSHAKTLSADDSQTRSRRGHQNDTF